MSAHCAPDTTLSYFVVAEHHPRRINGASEVVPRCVCADGVDPDLTRTEIVRRIAQGDYSDIAFVHFTQVNADGIGRTVDVTYEVTKDADNLRRIRGLMTGYDDRNADLLASSRDHQRKLRVEA